MSIGPPPMCVECKHYDKETLFCDAFGKTVPDAIWNNEADHRQPIKGDGGQQFEATPEFDTPKAGREWWPTTAVHKDFQGGGGVPESIHRPNAQAESTDGGIPKKPNFLLPALRKAANHGGVMVCLRVPADVAEDLALPDQELPEDLHLTLAYLGNADDADPDALQVLHDRLKIIALYFEPIEGRISGYGRFMNGDEDVLYASYDSPALAEFRRTIADMCAWSLLPASADHGFQPHITLAYIEPDADNDLLDGVENTPDIAFDRFELVVGDRIIQYGFDVEKFAEQVSGGGSGDGDSFGLHDRAQGSKKKPGMVNPHEGVLEDDLVAKKEDGDAARQDEEERKKPKKFPELPPDMGFQDAYMSEDEDGRWVTIRGNPVFINDEGVITRGPKALVGKKPSDVGGKKPSGPAYDPADGPLDIKHDIDKYKTGEIAESVVMDHLGEDSMALNKPFPNFPIDMMHKNELIEIKGGSAANGKSAQQWRFTFSLTKDEQRELKQLPKAKQEAYRDAKQKACRARKEAMLKQLEADEGKKFKRVTMGVIVNNDTKTADIYRFEGWHDRIGWTDAHVSKAFVATVPYGK